MKNKTGFTFTITSVLILLISGLVYKLTHEPEKVDKTRHVKKFAERKTFIPKKETQPFKKATRHMTASVGKKVTLSGKNYIVNEGVTATRTTSNGIVKYKEQSSPDGMPILTNLNNGVRAIFTGNLMVKISDNKIMETLIDRYGLKLVQEFKHLGTYYLGAKNPQTILKNMEQINQTLEGARVEYELIENPIKLK
jgi:hypothetical protein